MMHIRRCLALPGPARKALALKALALQGVAIAAMAGSAAAQTPHAWQFGMQTSHSPVEQGIHSLHNLVNYLMIAVVIFVAGLLGYVIWKFNAKRHPVASRVSHNTILEVAWTVVPVLILVVIAIPSFRLVYFEDRARDADMTIKVTGHQWYWEYSYPDAQNIDFNSNMVADEDIKPGEIRRLSVDNPLVVPAGQTIRILATGADVIHSFYIPSLGVQRYAIPGRTIETWMKVDQPGDYYGECNQICGTNHSAMPIHVQAVTDADYKTWLTGAKTKFASDLGPGQQHFASVAAPPSGSVAGP